MNAKLAARLEALIAQARKDYPSITDGQLCDAQMNADDSGFDVMSDDYATVFGMSAESIVKGY